MTMISRMIRMPLTELVTPKEGRICMLDRYWIVMDGEVFFFVTYGSPQCNVSEHICRTLRENISSRADITLVPVAYVPHSCGP